jgi:hypothetical protein
MLIAADSDEILGFTAFGADASELYVRATRPPRSASPASKTRPVATHSWAWLMPTTRGKNNSGLADWQVAADRQSRSEAVVSSPIFRLLPFPDRLFQFTGPATQTKVPLPVAA